jgi:hypothetical protein
MTEPLLRGYTIFCDDIRNEAGGKTTFVGVYDAILLIHGDFPFLLAKFGFGIRYMEKRNTFTDDVIIRIFMPGESEDGEPSFQGLLPIREARDKVQMHPDADADPASPRYLQLATNLVFSPFIIPQKGEMKVRAQCGSEIVKLGTLLIAKAASEDGAQPNANASQPPS